MTDKEKIRAEIIRLYNESLEHENRQVELGLKSAACTSYGKEKACKELLSFIDSMQEDSVSEELEEAAKTYAKKESYGYEPCNIVETFKAGAKWHKQQMMKEAVDGKIYETQVRSKLKATTTGYVSQLNYNVGDKVKLIIIKEGK